LLKRTVFIFLGVELRLAIDFISIDDECARLFLKLLKWLDYYFIKDG
jgi:hypothetical protein